MATNNSLNVSLSGQTGTGSFVGSSGSILTSADCGGATTLRIPVGTSPTTSTSGAIAVDANITNFNGMIKYRDSSQTLVGVSIPESDLASPTDGYIIGYNSSSTKLTLIPQNNGINKIAGYTTATSSSNDTTTSTSQTNTSLTASYTPVNSSNLILVYVYGYAGTSATSTTRNRQGIYYIRRTTGTPADLARVNIGRTASVSSSAPADSYYNVSIIGSETAGSTSTHTYVLQHSCFSNATTTFYGASCTAFMIIMEMEV